MSFYNIVEVNLANVKNYPVYPEAEVTIMAMRELRVYGDPVLTKTCRPVEEVSAHIRLLLDDMAETLKETPDCTVVAANQVGVLRRLVVVDTGSGINKLVNPIILEQSGEQDCLERCVCIKNISGMTIRPKKIVVEALDENGNTVTLTAENEKAQYLCRGIDYLDGKVFINHVYRFVSENED